MIFKNEKEQQIGTVLKIQTENSRSHLTSLRVRLARPVLGDPVPRVTGSALMAQSGARVASLGCGRLHGWSLALSSGRASGMYPFLGLDSDENPDKDVWLGLTDGPEPLGKALVMTDIDEK